MATPTASTGGVRMHELAQLLSDVRMAYDNMIRSSRGVPAAGSPAAVDAVALDATCAGVSGAPRGFELLSETVGAYMVVAAEQLAGLAAVYAAEEVLFTPGTLIRTIQENCARVLWVIGDPSDDPMDRLRRAYLEAVLSAEQKKIAVGRLGPKSASPYRDAMSEFDQVRANAQKLFGQVAGGNARWTIDQTQLIGPQACVEWMWDLLSAKAGATVGARQAKGVYDFLSGYVHPTIYVSTDMLTADLAGALPRRGDMRIETPFLERLASAAIFSFYNAMSYVMSYFGMDVAYHDSVTSWIDQVLPGSLT